MIRRCLLLWGLLMLMALPALAQEPEEPVTLTTRDGMTVTHVVNRSAWDANTTAELLVQHYCMRGQYDLAFALNEQLASMGDTAALYRLGCHYLSGQGAAMDEGAALECFAAAKAAGSREAERALILARFNGWGMPQDTLGATAEMTALGYSYELALLYLHGAYDVPAHEATALHWFDQSRGQMKEHNPQLYDKQLAEFLASSPTSLTDRLPVQHERWDNRAAQAYMGLALGKFWKQGLGGRTDLQAAADWYAFTTTLTEEREASWAHSALADMYLSGALGEIDVKKAQEHFLQDVYDGGYGAYRVGRMYWEGVTAADGTVLLAQETDTALAYLTEAAELGHPEACALLGGAYRSGERVQADVNRAAHFYALGLYDNNYSLCYEPLLAMYQQGLLYDRAVMDELFDALRHWRGTDHQLAILLAEHWLNGVTAQDGTVLVRQDRKAAFELMDYYHDYHAHLHETPEVFFLNWLGWFYSGNAPEAVERDYAKALRCYTESAETGNGYAMAMAGVFYQNGRGVPVNHMSARAWYKRAIAAGYTGAQGYLDTLNAVYPEFPMELAVTLSTSQGLTLSHVVNPAERTAVSDAELMAAGYALEEQWELALEINRQLAEQGDVAAMYRLGAHYAGGLGVQANDALAVEWLRKSADAGCTDAVFALACMYLNGWGVTQDAINAAAMLEGMGSALTADQLLMLATLYKCGYANLTPDEAAAQRSLDRAVALLNIAEEALMSDPIAAQETVQRRIVACQAAYGNCTAPDMRLMTRPQPLSSAWLDAPHETGEALAGFWLEGRGGVQDAAQAVRWYEYALEVHPDCATALVPLARLLRDGSAGYHDAQKALRLFCRAGAYDEICAMFETGVTGADGRLYLAPNAIFAEAFRTWQTTPGQSDTAARLGDLFRDGSIVAADPALAASFYWEAQGSQYCTDQLTVLIAGGQVTDEKLLYRIAQSVHEKEKDVSALIPALAETIIGGGAPDGVLWQADALRVVREMLDRAVAAQKMAPEAAQLLLERLNGQ